MYLVGSEVALYSPSLDDAGNGTSTLTDLVGSNDGTITGATWETDTDNGGVRALEFSSDYVTVSNSSDFAFGTDPFWYSVWFKLTSTSQQMILDKGYNTGNTNRFFFILINSTTWRLYSGGQIMDISAPGYLNTWTNMIYQRNGVTTTAWRDGSQVLQKTNLSVSANFTNTDIISIGDRADQTGTFPLTGRVDDVRLGSGVLTSGQIAKLSSQRVPSVALSSVMHGHFEAGIQ